MAGQNTQAFTAGTGPVPQGRQRRVGGGPGWTLGALVIAAVVLIPLVAVVVIAFNPTENIWPHLLATTLPRYLTNSVILAAGSAVLASAVGAGAAWLVTMYRFPLSRWLEWWLLLPMAIPAYVSAYGLVDLLDYAGPLQSALRQTFGWSSARDYWFFSPRSRGFAVVVLASALYPYVYLLSRAAFREQPSGSYEVARALGAGPWRLFWRIGLPLARPAIAAGAAIVMMEVVSDYGVSFYFGIQTLTTGIFSVWLETGNAGGAAQIACVILAVILCLMVLERYGRRRSRFFQSARQPRPVTRQTLRGLPALGATALCLVPLAMGFLLPTAVILGHALERPSEWLSPGLGQALVHTLVVGALASVLTVFAALFLVYAVRLALSRTARLVMPLTALGYGTPGAVLAVGILFPLAALDHRVADAILALTGHDPGLLLTGSAAAIVLAFVVRFFGIAEGAVDSAFGRISPSLPMAARSLGRTARGVLTSVYLPILRGSVGTALLLVFVECVKELPATLLLRPFNYETLATRVQEKASLEKLGEAAPPALIVMAVGLVAVALLARASRARER